MSECPADEVRSYAGTPDGLLEYYESRLEWYGNTKYLLELETRELCEKLLVEAGISYDLSNLLLHGLDHMWRHKDDAVHVWMGELRKWCS